MIRAKIDALKKSRAARKVAAAQPGRDAPLSPGTIPLKVGQESALLQQTCPTPNHKIQPIVECELKDPPPTIASIPVDLGASSISTPPPALQPASSEIQQCPKELSQDAVRAAAQEPALSRPTLHTPDEEIRPTIESEQQKLSVIVPSASPLTPVDSAVTSTNTCEQAQNPNDGMCTGVNEPTAKEFNHPNSLRRNLTTPAASKQHREHEHLTSSDSEDKRRMTEEDSQNVEWRHDDDSTTDDDMEPRSKRQRRPYRKSYSGHQNPLQADLVPNFDGNIKGPIQGVLKLIQSGSNPSFAIEFDCRQMWAILKGDVGLNNLHSPCSLPTPVKTSYPRARRQRSAFTPAEDAKLIELGDDASMSWKEIAEKFPSRAEGTLRTRYNLITQPDPVVISSKRKR